MLISFAGDSPAGDVAAAQLQGSLCFLHCMRAISAMPCGFSLAAILQKQDSSRELHAVITKPSACC